jgi:hypothetical protein
MQRAWDNALPRILLSKVSIRAGSLAEAWRSLSTRHLVRSALVLAALTTESQPFEYESAECELAEIYDALARRYGLAWTQDERTGVTWLHPRNLEYDHLLNARLQVEYSQPGLPMHIGILEPVVAGEATRAIVKQWGSAFLNTFDYAVDILAGAYTVRDVLNICCLANPTKTFLVRMAQNMALIMDINLVSEGDRLPEGAIHWWNLEVLQRRSRSTPTDEQLCEALAARSAEVRYAARDYLELVLSRVAVDALASHGISPARGLWASIGLCSVLVRSEWATHRASVKILRRYGTDSFLAQCPVNLALMSALELARLERDASALQIVMGRAFSSQDLAGVVSDACRVAGLSSYVREVLRTRSAQSLLESLPPLAALVQSPNPGKLRFEYVT